MHKSEAIQTALKALPLLPNTESIQKEIVIFLLNFDSTGSGKLPEKFTATGEKKALIELQNLEKFAKKLSDHINQLHQPAIVEMRDWGMRLDLLEELILTAEKAKQAGLRIKEKLETADAVLIACAGGRPQNCRAQALTMVLAINYHKLTGKQPTITTLTYKDRYPADGPFFEFVKSVFAALDLHENAEHFARLAANRYKE